MPCFPIIFSKNAIEDPKIIKKNRKLKMPFNADDSDCVPVLLGYM